MQRNTPSAWAWIAVALAASVIFVAGCFAFGAGSVWGTYILMKWIGG